MQEELEKLTKEQLVEEVKRLKELQTTPIVIKSACFGDSSTFLYAEKCSKCGCCHSEAAGVCKACNEAYDKYKVICLVKLPNGFVTTKTIKKYRKKADDTSIIEIIGDEIDVLRPYLGNGYLSNQNKEHEKFCYPPLLNEDDPCSCERIKRLDSFKKKDYMQVKDEVLIKIFDNWKTIFRSNIRKPESFYTFRKEHNS